MNDACQACKKSPATVHLTEVTREGEKKERHLCEQCAIKEGVTPKLQSVKSWPDLLAGFIISKATVRELAELKCPQCGMTFPEFRHHSMLGCPSDYDAFEKALVPLLERAHEGAVHHIGKVPRRLGSPRSAETDLAWLRRQLTKAVDEEDYEEAARLRDRIKVLETQ